MARADLEYFSEWMGYVNPPHILEWYKLATSPSTKRLLILGPRSHAKTECLSINLSSWWMGRDRNIRVLLVGNTDSQASALVRQIRLRVEGSEAYRRLFLGLEKEAVLWNDSALQVQRPRIQKDPTISGLGVLGPILGKRADLIVCDDIVDLENSSTQLQRDKLDIWFREVLTPVLEPDGKMIMIGSSYHYDDLYARLEKGGEYTVKKYRALREDGSALWPERWPLDKLEEKRREMGSILFNVQFMCEPSGMRGELLRDEWLKRWDSPPVSSFPVYAGIDPALGEGDLQAIASVAYDRTRNVAYLVDVWAERLPFPDFLRQVRRSFEAYRYEKMFLESNAFQKVMMYQPDLRGLPLVESVTDRDKERRFIAMSSHFEAGRVLVNPVLLRGSEFKSEWLQFPRGKNDDALDAVEIVLRNLVGEQGGDVDAFVFR